MKTAQRAVLEYDIQTSPFLTATGAMVIECRANYRLECRHVISVQIPNPKASWRPATVLSCLDCTQPELPL